MAAPLPGMIMGMTRSQIKREMMNRACSAISKHQIKAKTSKPVNRGSYKIYKNIKNNRPYTVKDVYRDTKHVMKFIKILKSRSLTNFFGISKSIVTDIQGRMKYAEYLKNIQDIQKKYNLNLFDKIIFDLSQKNNGMFTINDLQKSSKELFHNMFLDTKTADNFTQAFHDYIDFRVDSLNRVGFLNKHLKDERFEVTDLFFDRLSKLDLLNKDIPLDVDMGGYQLFILNDAIKSDGISINSVLEQFTQNPEIENPDERIKAFASVCEKLARYNYLEKFEKDDELIFKITEKGTSELYMYRDLDKLEKSIYNYLKEHKGEFDKQEYIKFLLQDKKLLSDIQKLQPMEEKKEQKPFTFSKYDANYLFKTFFENNICSKDKIIEIVNDSFVDPEEARKNYESVIRRLDKNCENGFLNYDNELGLYEITQKGNEAAENIGKEFTFTSYDVNVVFNYINKNNGLLSLQNLKDALNEEYKNPKEIDKQYKYLLSRIENNVKHGYIDKDTSGNYFLAEKGKNEEVKFFGDLEQKIDDKISFLKNAYLIDDNLCIKQLFHDVHDKRLSYFDNLLHEIAELNKGIFNVDMLIEGATIHYIHNMGATKQSDDKIKEFEDYLHNRIASLERIEFIRSDTTGNYKITDHFSNAFLKQGETKEILNIPGAANELSLLFNYIDNTGKSYITMADLKDALKREYTEPQELNNRLKYLEKSLNRSVDNGFILKDNNDRYFITSKGREKEKSCTNYHMFLINQASDKDGLSISTLLEKYKSEGLSDPEGKLSFTVKTLDKLTASKFLVYDTNGTYKITKQGVEEIYANRNFNTLEKLVISNTRSNDGRIDMQEITTQIMQDKKLVEQIKKSISSSTDDEKQFVFGRYDANVIFKEFDKNSKSLTLDDLRSTLSNRYEDADDVNTHFNIISKRIDKLVQNGYVDFDPVNGLYVINNKGIDTAKEVNKSFVFTSYDINVVFKYIEENGGTLSLDDLLIKLKLQYTDSEYIDGQMKYLRKRFDNNVKAGYLKKDANDIYSISEKGITEKNKDNVLFAEHINTKLMSLINMGLVENINDNYFVTDLFKNIADQKVNHMDKVLFEIALNNDGIIDFDTLSIELPNYINGDIEGYLEYFNERREAMLNAQYIIFLKDNTYEITEKFENIIVKSNDNLESKMSKYDALLEMKITSFDKAIFNAAHNDVIDLEERKSHFTNRFPTRPQEVERQLTMLSGRCEKLCNAGYLESCEQGFRVIRYPDKNNTQIKNTIRNTQREPLETFKITKFDYNNIVSFLNEDIWDVSHFRNLNTSLDTETLSNKILSITKRLKTLESMELANDLGDGRWQIDQVLIERSMLKSTDLSKEQIKILDDLKDFLNFTETQICEFFYGNKDKLFNSDINNLVNRGYIDFQSRDIFNTGNFEKVYYLTTSGKKEICKLFDFKMDDIHNSKIHKRPEELGHDLLIYSAFIDAKNALSNDNLIITKHMTDRQMRSHDMSINNKQRNDYADLYLEYEDIKTGEKGYINIEIDVGYSPKIIAEKASNIDNLYWYTNNQSQADKIAKYAKTTNIKVLSF